VGSVTTFYIAGLYEYSGSAAMRDNSGVYYLLQDHLNSTATSGGTVQDTTYYFPFGGLRGGGYSSLTTKRFTGQYHEFSVPGGEGLVANRFRWKFHRDIPPEKTAPSGRSHGDYDPV
jgi:hypothetical protein